MSQNADILAHLKRGRTITPLQALSLYGVLRLASRVEELRRAGHPIETRLVANAVKRFARYALPR